MDLSKIIHVNEGIPPIPTRLTLADRVPPSLIWGNIMDEKLRLEIEALNASLKSNWKLRTVAASPFIPIYKVAVSNELRDYILRAAKGNTVAAMGEVSVAIKLSELQKSDSCELAVSISMQGVEWSSLPASATTGLKPATSYGQVKVTLQGLSTLGTIDTVPADSLATYKLANEKYAELVKDGGYVGLDGEGKPAFIAQTKA